MNSRNNWFVKLATMCSFYCLHL